MPREPLDAPKDLPKQGPGQVALGQLKHEVVAAEGRELAKNPTELITTAAVDNDRWLEFGREPLAPTLEEAPLQALRSGGRFAFTAWVAPEETVALGIVDRDGVFEFPMPAVLAAAEKP